MKNTIAYFVLFSALSFSLIASEARSQAGGGSPIIKVDTFCDHWHICATDVVPLASVTLIDDPNGDVFGKPGKVFYNVRFDAILDTNNTGEIVFRCPGLAWPVGQTLNETAFLFHPAWGGPWPSPASWRRTCEGNRRCQAAVSLLLLTINALPAPCKLT